MNLFKLKYYFEILNICLFVACVYQLACIAFLMDIQRLPLYISLTLINLWQMCYHNSVFADLVEKWKKK